MHDAKGRDLKLGDVVLVPARIMYLSPGSDYYNVAVESVFGHPRAYIGSTHTGVMLRANDGDENDLAEIRAIARDSDQNRR